MLTSPRANIRIHPLDRIQGLPTLTAYPPVESFEEPIREWPVQPQSFNRDFLLGLFVLSLSLGLWILPWVLLMREWCGK